MSTRSWLMANCIGTSLLIAAALLLSPPFFYGLLVVVVGLSACSFLGLTHADDRLGRWLGVFLTLGHSATIWFFEHDSRVLVPAQSLLPLNALLFTLLRPGKVASAGRRATGIAFAPLWIGLLTYLAVARRAGGEHGAALATLALVTAALASAGGLLGSLVPKTRERDLFAFPRLIVDTAGAVVLATIGAVALNAFCDPLLPGAFGGAPPLLHALSFGASAGVLARIGRLGQALLERSLRAGAPAPSGWAELPAQLSALLLTSALAYGDIQLQLATSPVTH